MAYKLINRYELVTLRDLTTGERHRNPMDYYHRQAERSYGQTSLDLLDLAIEVGGHQANMLLGKEGLYVEPSQIP